MLKLSLTEGGLLCGVGVGTVLGKVAGVTTLCRWFDCTSGNVVPLPRGYSHVTV